MIEILCLAPGHPLWEEAEAFARGSGWSAGPYLADKMARGDLLPWERVFFLRAEGAPAGYCLFAQRDELPEDYDISPFIGFVYVDPGHRGERLSQALLGAAEAYAGGLGFRWVYLMSGEKGLYEKYGYEPLEEYDTIWGTRDRLFRKGTGRTPCCGQNLEDREETRMRAIVTVIGKDQVGIIAAVCAQLSGHGVNVLDISQTILQEYFTMIMLVDTAGSDLPFAELSELLEREGREKGLSIRMQREDIFDAMHRI